MFNKPKNISTHKNKKRMRTVMKTPAHVSNSTFRQEVLDAQVPVLVDFYADWCGPCRMLAPVLDRLSAEFQGRAKIVKINVDEEPELASEYRVSAIPTLLLVQNGEVVGRGEGMASEANLRSALEQMIAASGADT
ncbi:MAG: thioredoxin [Pirellulales bacterium]